MKNNLLDTDLQWIVRRTAENLHLTEREVAGLEKYLWKNYLRDICAMEAFVGGVDDIGPRVLHPVMFEALREAAAMRREILEAQGRSDRLDKIVTPHFFRHSPIYAHRVWKPTENGEPTDYGVIIQTIALDVSDELPLTVLRELVSCQLQIPLSILHLFYCAAPARAEVYDYDRSTVPVAERMDWEETGASLQKLQRRMIPLPPSDHTLKDLRIGPGSEIFCLASAPLDLDTLCIEGLKRAWAGDANLFSQLARIPIPFISDNRSIGLVIQEEPAPPPTGEQTAPLSPRKQTPPPHHRHHPRPERSSEHYPSQHHRSQSRPSRWPSDGSRSQYREYYRLAPEHQGYRGDEEIHFYGGSADGCYHYYEPRSCRYSPHSNPVSTGSHPNDYYRKE